MLTGWSSTITYMDTPNIISTSLLTLTIWSVSWDFHGETFLIVDQQCADNAIQEHYIFAFDPNLLSLR